MRLPDVQPHSSPSSGDIAYHLRELEIARSTTSDRRSLPSVGLEQGLVLDVGCGAGQSLIALALPSAVVRVGVDSDRRALAVGLALDPSLILVCADGARLPFRDAQFDAVYSRVAMPYMRFPDAVFELRRVLRRGGQLWLALHTLGIAMRPLLSGLRHLNVKPVIYCLYVFVNGITLHLLGRTFSFPLKRQRHESFQTLSGMRRVLRRARVRLVRAESGPHFVVEGQAE